VQPVKLKNLLGAVEVELADDKQVFDLTGVPTGYLGPVGLDLPMIADREVAVLRNVAVGANEKNFHLVNANPGRDFQIEQVADLRMVVAEDRCPLCGGGLELTRGIEVGHIFKLGTKYSEAMKATFLDQEGKERFFIMGCYGIGVSRTIAAAIEQNHDRDGIIFPLPIAPFQVLILNLSPRDEKITAAAAALYDGLLRQGLDVLLDDRDERPGSKFKDADLIGIPYRVMVGKRFTQDGVIEVRSRADGHAADLLFEGAVENLTATIRAELARYR
jgi:prolyl-tRNA synthetase